MAVFVFHVLFWKLFRWKQELIKLSDVNRAVMQVLNLCLMWVFLIFAYVSIFHADELLTTGLGKSVLIGMVLFGIFRSVEQVIFFNLKDIRSKFVLFVAMIGTAIYAIPLVIIYI